MAALTVLVTCPKCDTEHSRLLPTSEGARLTARCINPACNRQFTIVTVREEQRGDLVVKVGFLAKDDAKNKELPIKLLDKLSHKEACDVLVAQIALVNAYVGSYMKQRRRLQDLLNQRSNAALSEAALVAEKRERARRAEAERARAADAERQKQRRAEARAAEPPKDRVQGKIKGTVDLGMYRNNLFMFADMRVQMGQMTAAQAKALKDAAYTQTGLWALADALGMPRLD